MPVADIPDKARIHIWLVDLAGLRSKEAASVLGLSPGAVRMRLMRARGRLRKAAGGPAASEDRGEGDD